MTTIQQIFKQIERSQTDAAQSSPSGKAKAIRNTHLGSDICGEFGRIHMINTDHIIPGDHQPRKSFDNESIIRLADSIRHYGILQPVTVRRIEGYGIDNALFEIIAGERRFRASKLIGLTHIPCLLITADDRRSAEVALIENIQRENLNMFELASAIASLTDMYGMTQEQTAKRLSVSQSFVANKLRILRLTSAERETILRYGLTERHARALLRIDSAAERLSIIEYIHIHCLNVAATETYIEKCLAEHSVIARKNAPRKLILKDLRIFYNTIDRAVSVIKQSGVEVVSERVDTGDAVELTIRIPKCRDVSRETPED